MMMMPMTTSHWPADLPGVIRAGLAALGIRRLVLAIHDASFPGTPDEDLGRGSPYGEGARELLEFAAAFGFTGLQLGPQGDTAASNPSPYEGALFTKSPMSLAPATLMHDPDWAPLCEGLLAPLVEARPPGPPDRTRHEHAWHASRLFLERLHARYLASGATDGTPGAVADRFTAFREAHGRRLLADGDFETLSALHGTDDWRRWGERGAEPAVDVDRVLHCPTPALAAAAERRRHALHANPSPEAARHLFGQFVLHEQHQALRRWLAEGPRLALYGDLQIGFSHRDVWSRRALFRRDYLMGAPPSRTNPAGQPWMFPVLDPDRYFEDRARRTPGPVLRLVEERIGGLLDDFDGLRIDHPHGLVCPWVYAAADPDPAGAVLRGARLFCSPHLDDHPALRALAIPTREQIAADPGIARYADDWVKDLRPEQVDEYGILFDAVVGLVTKAGREPLDVVCEVLSTWPYPLRRVMSRHGLGRFCVLQKADLARPDDVYRGENTSSGDWIMVGNHDTPPIWALADSWHGTAAGARWAAYLSERLVPSPSSTSAPLRTRWARWIAADSRNLCQALFAALFLGPARQVSVFFADLFGLRQIYNRPGIVQVDNWTLRLPSDWRDRYLAGVARSDAFNVPLALAMALTARAPAEAPTAGPSGASVIASLVAAARALTPALDEEIVSLLTTSVTAGSAGGGDGPAR
jgi:4-alpha-glucanotransferase